MMAATILWRVLAWKWRKWLHHLDIRLGADAHSHKLFFKTLPLPLFHSWGAADDENFYCGWPVADHRGRQHRTVRTTGKRANLRCRGEAEPDEDVLAKVVNVADKARVTITANDVSTFHCLPGGGKGPETLIAKFVLRETQNPLTMHRRNLKETSIYVNDDLIPIPPKINRDMRINDDIRGVVTAADNIIVFLQNNPKFLFDNYTKLQKWKNELITNACKGLKKYCFWILGISEKFSGMVDFFFYAFSLITSCSNIEENSASQISYKLFRSCLWSIKIDFLSFTRTFKM